jgi:hypothetical protein
MPLIGLQRQLPVKILEQGEINSMKVHLMLLYSVSQAYVIVSHLVKENIIVS